MMQAKSRDVTDVWVKWDWLWSTIFYGSLALSAALAIINQGGFSADLGLLLGLTVFWAGWHFFGLRIAYRGLINFNERAYQRFIILLVDIALWFILVNLSPSYYIALFGLISQIFRHLPIRYAAFAAILLMGLMGFEEFTDQDQSFTLSSPRFWIFMIMGVSSLLFAYWISAIIEQSHRRRELLEKLAAAQAELAAAERREGVLQERQRLAGEIHDTLAQGFTSIVMNLEAAEAALPDDLATLQTHLDRARSTARNNLEEARRVLQDLRPELLEQQALPEAISRASARWSAETGIPVEVTITGEQWPLHQDIEVTLLRAAQEGLNNIRKHANARQVRLTLSYMPDMIILDVQDDGQGVENASKELSAGGFGLPAMRKRVEGLGGDLLLESEPDEGTTLVIIIPCSSAKLSSDEVG